MKKIRTLVVEDEPLARAGLEALLSDDGEIDVVGACADGQSALEKIRGLRPDLVFLDIQLPKRDGFDVLAAIPPEERPIVIFATAHDQHAIRAFEFGALDFLLKPYGEARFRSALARAKAAVRKIDTTSLAKQVEVLLHRVEELGSAKDGTLDVPDRPESSSDRVVLKIDGALHFIKTTEVIWIEAQGDFVKVQTAGKIQLVRETLQTMERRLDRAKFLRIHRSFLVNLAHVKKVEMALYGDYSVTMSDGTKLRLSRNYRAKLKALIKQAPVA